MTRLADTALQTRQVLARGQVSDSVTGQTLEDYSVRLGLQVDGDSLDFPVQLNYLPGGWFALWLIPAQLPALLGAATAVELRLHIRAPGHGPASSNQTVPGSHFALQGEALGELPGTDILRMRGAPLDFIFALTPHPVALHGIVIYGNDPHRPVPGASVSAAGGLTVTAGSDGRFVIAQVPPVQILQLEVSDGTNTQTHHISIDHNRPVNVATLSLSE